MVQLINIGTGPNTKDGDTVRLAFQKVNNNFAELISSIVLDAGSQPPETNNQTGKLWWDSTDGNLYVRYNNSWVPAMSTNINTSYVLDAGPQPPETNNQTGKLWWDSTDGNLYVRYNNSWVPATSTNINISYQPDNLTHWTSPVNTVADALEQIAARLYAIEQVC
jgi:hypothetical protein